MNDVAFKLLLQPLNQAEGSKVLWLVDENISAAGVSAVRNSPALRVLCNRYDLHLALSEGGFESQLADYDFSAFEPYSIDAIYYRVSKEKAVVHHCINQAAVYLKPGGKLYLAGYKNEGIKSYVDKAAGLLAGTVDKQRGSNSALLATLGRASVTGAPLDDKNYRQTIELSTPEADFISKPGVYGWNKIDKGSALLIEQLADFVTEPLALAAVDTPVTVVDLGCGYGYLSVMASKHLAARYIATDNNVASVELCRQNFTRHGVAGEVVLDDCGGSIMPPVDMVLCNPPFHQGFDVVGDLTSRFIQASHRLLKQGGYALFVVNSFIGIEKKAKGLFRQQTALANNGSFKVIAFKK